MRILLQDPSDPRLDDYRGLRERDVARDRGAFIAEGAEVIARLVASPWAVRSVLVAAERWRRLASTLARLPYGTPVYVLPLDAMRELVGFDIHRGLLASGARGTGPGVHGILADRGPLAVLALLGLGNTDNVGACFRNAAGFGVPGVVLDDRCADPLYRRALRVSMGHALRVPFEVLGSARSVLDRLEAESIVPLALTPDPAARDLGTLLPGDRSGRFRMGAPASRGTEVPARFALLVGAEGPGLPREVLERATLRVRIPMVGGTDSLNVATAAAVAMYALRRIWPAAFSGPGAGSGRPGEGTALRDDHDPGG